MTADTRTPRTRTASTSAPSAMPMPMPMPMNLSRATWHGLDVALPGQLLHHGRGGVLDGGPAFVVGAP
ncbi:hypothetical protein [Streptomyces longisporoflavus]|uniref:Uncharacterized protein n=1 Tax=Streptomyces longisporoflavus TaxID=28044 RepID=A0ABW7QJ32_9ACTN